MSDIYVGELQDYEGNTVYPHTEANVVWLPVGTSVSDFLKAEVTDAEINSMFES